MQFDLETFASETKTTTIEDPWGEGWRIEVKPATDPEYQAAVRDKQKAEGSPMRPVLEKMLTLQSRREIVNAFAPDKKNGSSEGQGDAVEGLNKGLSRQDLESALEGFNLTFEDTERLAKITARVTAKLIAGWSGIKSGGQEIPYSAEAAERLLLQEKIVPPGRHGAGMTLGQALSNLVAEAAVGLATSKREALESAEGKSVGSVDSN